MKKDYEEFKSQRKKMRFLAKAILNIAIEMKEMGKDKDFFLKFLDDTWNQMELFTLEELKMDLQEYMQMEYATCRKVVIVAKERIR